VVGDRDERRAASWASISDRMWKKCELEVGVRCRSSGRVSSLPSVNFERRRGRVWIRRRGGEGGEGVGFAIAIFWVLGVWLSEGEVCHEEVKCVFSPRILLRWMLSWSSLRGRGRIQYMHNL
jgi:hypothetical protein